MLAAFLRRSNTAFMSGLSSGSSAKQSSISSSICVGHSLGTMTSLLEKQGSSPVTISQSTTPKLHNKKLIKAHPG